MNIKYSDEAVRRNDVGTLLRQASTLLEEVLGPSAGQVAVEWDRGQDGRGRPIYTLKLSDSTGEVSASVAPEELRAPSHLRGRLLELWGNLLQVRSDKQVQKLQELVAEGE